MEIEQWWVALGQTTREWLIANNGDAISQSVANEIVAVGGTVISEPEPEGGGVSNGLFLSSDNTDWIEAFANDET